MDFKDSERIWRQQLDIFSLIFETTGRVSNKNIARESSSLSSSVSLLSKVPKKNKRGKLWPPQTLSSSDFFFFFFDTKRHLRLFVVVSSVHKRHLIVIVSSRFFFVCCVDKEKASSKTHD